MKKTSNVILEREYNYDMLLLAPDKQADTISLFYRSQDVGIEMLDYNFLDRCTDPDLIRSIVRKLKSGEEGHYPDLLKVCLVCSEVRFIIQRYCMNSSTRESPGVNWTSTIVHSAVASHFYALPGTSTTSLCGSCSCFEAYSNYLEQIELQSARYGSSSSACLCRRSMSRLTFGVPCSVGRVEVLGLLVSSEVSLLISPI